MIFFRFFRAMNPEQGLSELFNRHFQYSIMAFEELQAGIDPGLLFKHKNWVFREMMDGHELIQFKPIMLTFVAQIGKNKNYI